MTLHDAIARQRDLLRLEERESIERRARLSDAYDALRAAVVWLHGEYREKPRSEFNGEAWYRKARSGNVGLRDDIAAEPVNDRAALLDVVEAADAHVAASNAIKLAMVNGGASQEVMSAYTETFISLGAALDRLREQKGWSDD